MRPFVLIAVALCACGDEAPNDLPIAGQHHSYVVSREYVPTTNTQAREYGLDLNRDGAIDNQFGMVLSTFASDNLLQSQVRTDGVIDRGDLLQLIDLQRPEAGEDAATGFALQIGAAPQPTPCTDAADDVCRHHLDGTGSFTLASPASDPPLHCLPTETGFQCGPGRLKFQLGIMGTPLQVPALGFPPLEIELLGARATFEDVGDGSLRGRIGGGVSDADMDRLFTDYLEIIDADVANDCGIDPPACSCALNSSGKFYIGSLDANHDCSVAFDELKKNTLIVSLLAPDLVMDGKKAISLGIGFEAVPATIR
jgi:hypothetical protein